MTYEVHVAEADSEYDFIFFLVRHGCVKAVETLRKNNIKVPLFFFCNFWDTRKRSSGQDYDLFWPFRQLGVTCRTIGVLFDHLMLEAEQKAHISNYSDLTTLLTSADLKWETSWYGRMDLDSHGD